MHDSKYCGICRRIKRERSRIIGLIHKTERLALKRGLSEAARKHGLTHWGNKLRELDEEYFLHLLTL